MQYIIGLDLSLSGSGLCIINDAGNIILKTVIESKRIDDSINGRYTRYNNILKSLISNLENIAIKKEDVKIICIESISYNSTGKVVQIAESSALIKDYLFKVFKDCDFYEIAPISAKKYLLGKNAGAGKNLILLGCYKEYGVELNNDNIADAVNLSYIGLSVYNKKSKNIECKKIYQSEVINNIIKKGY